MDFTLVSTHLFRSGMLAQHLALHALCALGGPKLLPREGVDAAIGLRATTRPKRPPKWVAQIFAWAEGTTRWPVPPDSFWAFCQGTDSLCQELFLHTKLAIAFLFLP